MKGQASTGTTTVFFVLLSALAPVFLAASQEVPANSVYKQVVLMVSLAAFGLILAQFWLSRLKPRALTDSTPVSVLRWHRVIGYAVCVFLLVHPVLMIARRFWVLESDPVHNLVLMLRAPSMLPAIAGWLVMVLIVGLSLVRGRVHPRTWRTLHGLLSLGFVWLAVWHVVTVGRHSNAIMSISWIGATSACSWILLRSWLTKKTTGSATNKGGVTHEIAA